MSFLVVEKISDFFFLIKQTSYGMIKKKKKKMSVSIRLTAKDRTVPKRRVRSTFQRFGHFWRVQRTVVAGWNVKQFILFPFTQILGSCGQIQCVCVRYPFFGYKIKKMLNIDRIIIRFDCFLYLVPRIWTISSVNAAPTVQIITACPKLKIPRLRIFYKLTRKLVNFRKHQ